MKDNKLVGFVEFLNLLQNAHKKGYDTNGDAVSKAYHAGAYNTLMHVMKELGEEITGKINLNILIP